MFTDNKSFVNNPKQEFTERVIRLVPTQNIPENNCFLGAKKYFFRNFSAHIHSMKSVRIWSYSGLHFPAFGLNVRDTEYLFVFSLNAGNCGPE